MANKMTLVEFKNYVKKEAEKLYKTALLKEEKEKITAELSILSESDAPLALGVALMDPEIMKQVRQEMLKKAAGWAVPEPKQQLDERKYSTDASDFISKEISHLVHDKGYSHDRAVAAALSVAREKGYKIPSQKNEITDKEEKFAALASPYDKITYADKIAGAKKSEEMDESGKPSAGLSTKQKSNVVKQAKAGHDIGHKGKGFKDVEAKAKEYGAKDPEAVAAAAMWKNIKRH